MGSGAAGAQRMCQKCETVVKNDPARQLCGSCTAAGAQRTRRGFGRSGRAVGSGAAGAQRKRQRARSGFGRIGRAAETIRHNSWARSWGAAGRQRESSGRAAEPSSEALLGQKCETVVIKWVRAQPRSSGAAGKQFGRSGKAVRAQREKVRAQRESSSGAGKMGSGATGAQQVAGAQRARSGTAAGRQQVSKNGLDRNESKV